MKTAPIMASKPTKTTNLIQLAKLPGRGWQNQPSRGPILLIDTATDRASVAVITDQVLSHTIGDARVRADDLLTMTQQTLASARQPAAALAGIVVCRGLGSYTGLRVGLTVANTLGWAWAKPVIGVLQDKPQLFNPSHLARRYESLLARLLKKDGLSRPTIWLLPTYARWQSLPPSATIKTVS